MKKRHNNPKEGFNLLVFKALKFFIENPYEEIHLRGFSRKLRISPNTAQRFLSLFFKENLINEERKANLRYFKANHENLVFRHIKKSYSMKLLTDSGLLEYLKENKFSNIVLFGRLAEIASQYLKKGSLVFLEGRIRTRSWEDSSGNKRYRTEIIVQRLQLPPKSIGKVAPPQPEKETKEEQEEIPIIEEGGEIDVKDIPF